MTGWFRAIAVLLAMLSILALCLSLAVLGLVWLGAEALT